jgi:glycosyltransferase involved in cell wall biosynthesis
LFENTDDPREFGLDPAGPDVAIVGGAGVDPAQFPASPAPPAPPVKAAVVARMLVPKGIAETVAAVRRARAQGAPVELNLYGAPDPSNRRSYSEDQLRQWSAQPGVAWRGPTDDVARVWRENHVAVLLSYREGLPKGLVEAAAAGRPIVTTDVTGCREVVRDGIEGLLVPLGDIDAAARALARLAGDAPLRARMGAAAHARFRERFTEEAVMRTMTELYAGLRNEIGT